MMSQKEVLEDAFSQLRIKLTRVDRAALNEDPETKATAKKLRKQMHLLRERLVRLDGEIAPLARRHGELGNTRWGLLFRAGNDKSHLARQIERYADTVSYTHLTLPTICSV